jgi:hypothetical protein
MMAAIMSFLIMSQQDLKKAPMYPSGPGALTAGREKTASLISSSVKATSKSHVSDALPSEAQRPRCFGAEKILK